MVSTGGCRQGKSWGGRQNKQDEVGGGKTGKGSREEEGRMAGKMSMGARMEVAKPGREVELLWVSKQQKRGLRGGQAKGEARESPARANAGRGGLGGVQQEKQFSSTCSLQGREEQGWGWTAVCIRGRRANRDRQLAGHSLWQRLPGMPALSRRPIPVSSSPTGYQLRRAREGAAHAPGSSQPSGQ